jgi:hypothetical protein
LIFAPEIGKYKWKRQDKNIKLLKLDIYHDWGVYAEDSVRSALFAQQKAGIDRD